MELVVAWIICGVLAWFLFVNDWRKHWDLTIWDALFFGIFAVAGPFGLTVALFWTVIGLIACKNGPVLWRKK
jgi:hypothetical protein